ncbi:MAG: hypothetical protein OXC40_06355 [Proteobacteria bacterium]|nr:hypothetical protein [Pseudomonadota bacterium]
MIKILRTFAERLYLMLPGCILVTTVLLLSSCEFFLAFNQSRGSAKKESREDKGHGSNQSVLSHDCGGKSQHNQSHRNIPVTRKSYPYSDQSYVIITHAYLSEPDDQTTVAGVGSKGNLKIKWQPGALYKFATSAPWQLTLFHGGDRLDNRTSTQLLPSHMTESSLSFIIPWNHAREDGKQTVDLSFHLSAFICEKNESSCYLKYVVGRLCDPSKDLN